MPSRAKQAIITSIICFTLAQPCYADGQDIKSMTHPHNGHDRPKGIKSTHGGNN